MAKAPKINPDLYIFQNEEAGTPEGGPEFAQTRRNVNIARADFVDIEKIATPTVQELIKEIRSKFGDIFGGKYRWKMAEDRKLTEMDVLMSRARVEKLGLKLGSLDTENEIEKWGKAILLKDMKLERNEETGELDVKEQISLQEAMQGKKEAVSARPQVEPEEPQPVVKEENLHPFQKIHFDEQPQKSLKESLRELESRHKKGEISQEERKAQSLEEVKKLSPTKKIQLFSVLIEKKQNLDPEKVAQSITTLAEANYYQNPEEIASALTKASQSLRKQVEGDQIDPTRAEKLTKAINLIDYRRFFAPGEDARESMKKIDDAIMKDEISSKQWAEYTKTAVLLEHKQARETKSREKTNQELARLHAERTGKTAADYLLENSENKKKLRSKLINVNFKQFVKAHEKPVSELGDNVSFFPYEPSQNAKIAKYEFKKVA